MQEHWKSTALAIVAALSVIGALATMGLGYADIDRWWMNPLIWVAAIAVLGASFAQERELRAMREERERERARLLEMVRRSLEGDGQH